MTRSKASQIVWHDLFTPDRARSMAFYERVAGWDYLVERATDFAWGGGEKDFVLALAGDEAGAGFAETPPNEEDGWIAYLEVRNVDAAVERVGALGGAILRQPFDVPGVGRNALVRDPLGARLGLSLSRHDFPTPRGQFGPEIYLSRGDAFPEAFYAELFGWREAPGQGAAHRASLGPSGDLVAVSSTAPWLGEPGAAWVPRLTVASVAEACRAAEASGGRRTGEDAGQTGAAPFTLLTDPTGTPFALSARRTRPD
ncbi:MAG: VOC family protein [Pseudomonadota bacterium]